HIRVQLSSAGTDRSAWWRDHPTTHSYAWIASRRSVAAPNAILRQADGRAAITERLSRMMDPPTPGIDEAVDVFKDFLEEINEGDRRTFLAELVEEFGFALVDKLPARKRRTKRQRYPRLNGLPSNPPKAAPVAALFFPL